MEGSVNDLAIYRLEKAEQNLKIAKDLLDDETFGVSLNRSYYAAFDAMRAVNALDGFDSSKHSGVISHFNKNHVKSGEFDPKTASIIKRASLLREKSDYEDFYEPEKIDAELSLSEVEQFVEDVRTYLIGRIQEREESDSND